MKCSIIINGKEHSISGCSSLMDYLSGAGYNPDRIAVEKNGEIVPKSEYEKTMLTDCDTLEIVEFVGGG